MQADILEHLGGLREKLEDIANMDASGHYESLSAALAYLSDFVEHEVDTHLITVHEAIKEIEYLRNIVRVCKEYAQAHRFTYRSDGTSESMISSNRCHIAWLKMMQVLEEEATEFVERPLSSAGV